MKKRVVQILLALLVIIYRKTWFWWIFNHFAGRLVPASREFFQILSFLEFSVTFLATSNQMALNELVEMTGRQ